MTTNRNFLGYTDEITVCGCCGKINLKGTYAIEIEGFGLVFYGSSCVQKTFDLSARNLEKIMTRIGRKNNGDATYKKAA